MKLNLFESILQNKVARSTE